MHHEVSAYAAAVSAPQAVNVDIDLGALVVMGALAIVLVGVVVYFFVRFSGRH